VEGLNSNLVEFLPVDLPVAVLSAPTKRSFRGMPPRSRLTSEVHRLNPLLSIACSMAARRRLLRDGIVLMTRVPLQASRRAELANSGTEARATKTRAGSSGLTRRANLC